MSALSAYNFWLLLDDIRYLEENIMSEMGNPSGSQFQAETEEAPSVIRRLRRSIDKRHTTVETIAHFRDLMVYGLLLWLFVLAANMILIMLVIRKAQQPLAEIGTFIAQLSEGDLDTPIRTSGSSPISRLVYQLETLREQLRRAEDSQTQFFRQVSHQIKTPLTSIKEGSRLLDEGALGEINSEQKEVTNIIIKNTTELQQSIESLLNYNAALSAAKNSIRSTVDLQHILFDIVEKLQLSLRAKKLEIIDQTNDVEALVDEDQFATVFENLLSNAIKYSPPGGKIRLELEAHDENIVFTIQDEGPGIPESQRLSVFNAFFVGDSAPGQEIASSGLGLSIARQYIELHRGTIEALDSSHGSLSGACFRVRLSR